MYNSTHVGNQPVVCLVIIKLETQSMVNEDTPPAPTPPKLLDQVRDKLRVKHYSIGNEQAYSGWIKRFIRFAGKHASF
jgi:hypothetical protein